MIEQKEVIKMDMYQKRKIRAEKKNNDSQKSFSKVPISWYPGHMAKTRRQIESDIKIVDIVIELLDARIPISSQNPDIAQIISKKKKIVVLNKGDLADDNKNKQWLEYFQKRGIPAVITDSSSGRGIDNCIKEIEKIMEEQLLLQANKGRIGRKIRAMVLGLPNVGKSSFINRISKRTTAGVGNKPGVTKGKQWIKLNKNIELLDTPGILWPKFEDQQVGLRLALIGSIRDEILNQDEMAIELIEYLKNHYQGILADRYQVDENEDKVKILEQIALNRNCKMKGNELDYEKASKIVLEEFRNGKLGKISLETPEEGTKEA